VGDGELQGAGQFLVDQLREYSRGLRQAYSPFICLTTTSESENTCRALAFNSNAYCKASSNELFRHVVVVVPDPLGNSYLFPVWRFDYNPNAGWTRISM
jgi:hypothetical protein